MTFDCVCTYHQFVGSSDTFSLHVPPTTVHAHISNPLSLSLSLLNLLLTHLNSGGLISCKDDSFSEVLVLCNSLLLRPADGELGHTLLSVLDTSSKLGADLLETVGAWY